jgi:HEAT repeat protein
MSLRQPRRWLVAALFTLAIVSPARGEDPEEGLKEDEATLRAVELKTDGPSLLAFFRKLTPRPEDVARVRALIGQLDEEDFLVRQKAYEELLAIGPPARSQLTRAARHKDVEVRWRARRCLEKIQSRAGPRVVSAAGRVLAARLAEAGEAPWTREVTGTLLAFLPHAEDRDVAAEVAAGVLQRSAIRDGKPTAALRAALADKQAVRRLAAGLALVRAGAPEQRPAVRKLLADADLNIRRRMGEALLRAGDKEAMVPFIGLLTRLPEDDVWRVEEVLYDAAGEGGPVLVSAASPEEREKAWQGWWAKRGEAIDLAAALKPKPLLGYTVMTVKDPKDRTKISGRVMEVDGKGKVRWEIKGLRSPVDAEVVGKDRVVIAEYANKVVSERDFKGKVIWYAKLPDFPLGVQRLRNGNTFVFTFNALVELDGKGKEVLRINRTDTIWAAYRRRNGETVIVTKERQCIRLDPRGKEIKSFTVGTIWTWSKIEVLPSGRILIPDYARQQIAEYDLDGRLLRPLPAAGPVSVDRLSDQSILVAGYFSQRVYAVDDTGKEVWSFVPPGRPYSARRR